MKDKIRQKSSRNPEFMGHKGEDCAKIAKIWGANQEKLSSDSKQ